MSADDILDTINRANRLSGEGFHRDALDVLAGPALWTTVGSAVAAYSLANLLDFDGARDALSRIAASIGTDPIVDSLVGSTLLMLGDLERAAGVLDRLVQTYRPEFGAALRLATLYLSQGRLDDANSVILRSRAAFPEHTVMGRFEGQILSTSALLAGSSFTDSQGIDVPEHYLSTVNWRWREMLDERPVLRSLAPIYVVGDSHAQIFSGTTLFLPRFLEPIPHAMPPFIPYNLGAVLAYNLERYGTRTQGREKLDWLRATGRIPPGATIMLSVGEIDVRAHVFEQAERQGLPVTTIIDTVVAAEIRLAEDLMAQGHPIVLWGPIGTVPDDSATSWYGRPPRTEVERNQAARYYNEQLRREADRRGIFVVSVFDLMVDANNHSDGRLLFDGLHLGFWAIPMIQDAFRRTFPIIS